MDYIRLGEEIIYALRQAPWEYELEMNDKGFVDIEQLLSAINEGSKYAKIIDKYFSMYGYKINDLKLPNISGRSNWNYVKTIGCNILGDIPQEDMEKIKRKKKNISPQSKTLTAISHSRKPYLFDTPRKLL